MMVLATLAGAAGARQAWRHRPGSLTTRPGAATEFSSGGVDGAPRTVGPAAAAARRRGQRRMPVCPIE
jgi:hypothetical protein